MSLPAWHDEVLQSRLGRGGTFLSLLAMSNYLSQQPADKVAMKPANDDHPKASDVKVLPVEELNGVKTRVVQYRLSWTAPPAELGTAKVRVWIDPETKLPLRRTMIFEGKSGGDTFTAIHTKFEIDLKLEDKLFEIPKAK